MSHYTIAESGNRGLSRRKTGHTTRFSDIPPRFNMSHFKRLIVRLEYHIKRYIHFIYYYYYYYYYTISEPGNRGLSRSKTGPTTRFGGAMLSTLYHSRLHVCLYLLNAAIPHSSCVARDMNYTK